MLLNYTHAPKKNVIQNYDTLHLDKNIRDVMSFVYVATNPDLPNLVKIGVAVNPKKRLKTLSNTSLPREFELHFAIETDLALKIESHVHSAMKEYRVSQNREFFKCSIEEAVSFILQSKEEIENNHIPRTQNSTQRENPYENQSSLKSLINLEQHYENLITTMRALNISLLWRKRNDKEYLYQRKSSTLGSIEKSLGPRNHETEEKMEEWSSLKSRKKAILQKLNLESATCKIHKFSTIETTLGKILRQLDIDGQNGDGGIMIVGTQALLAYEYEAMSLLPDTLKKTVNTTLAWRRTAPWNKMERPILDSLKRADSTWTINAERIFQALDNKGNELEVLAAKTVSSTLGNKGFRPVDIPEQEWLLQGTPVVQVLPTTDRNAARVMAPDPRWFALHKIFMSTSERRDPKKKGKDLIQGVEVLNLVSNDMPHYPLDEHFEAELPDVLKPIFQKWKNGEYVVAAENKLGKKKTP